MTLGDLTVGIINTLRLHLFTTTSRISFCSNMVTISKNSTSSDR